MPPEIAQHPAFNAVPHTPLDDLCLDFINSRFHDHRGTGLVYDRLPMAGWWSWLVERWELGPCPPPSGVQLAELRRLRSRVRRLLEAVDPLSTRDRRALGRILSQAPVIWQFSEEPGSAALLLRAVSSGFPHVAASIVVSVVEVLSGDGSRVRRCANPHCSFLFRDTSRSGSRRWCDPGICGNLIKVRAFRAGRGAGVR